MAFTNPNDPRNVSLTAKLKEWLVKHFHFSAEIEVAYTELRCADPACPCVQTFLKVEMPDGELKTFKIGKPFVYLREADIEILKKA